MNAHTPFDANQDWTNPYCRNSSNDPMVDALLGNAYHVVRTVYCNLGNLKLIYDFLNQYGMVLGVQSEAELKALTTKAKYARIYGFSRAGDRQVTDYLYVEGDRTGILPNDTAATGSWITVATSGSNSGGTSSGEGAYIPWVYANGSAAGGETTINVPDNTVGVPFIIVNGDMQYVGRGFEFNVENLSVTLAQPLEEGDEVVFLLTGTPAVPDNPNVNDWIQINWLYNNGAAVGGEQVIAIPYTFQSVPAVYKNGLRLAKNLATNSYLIDTDKQSIILTEPLTTNDRVIIQIGGEARVVEVSDRTVQEIARSLNVSDSAVILSTNTTSTLNGKKFLYSVEQQKVYELPLLPSNIYISAVSGQTLTYNPGEIQVTLKEVITGKVLQSRIEAPDGATLYPELQIARWRDEGDVRGWGAVGDGVTDDTTALQAAISSRKAYLPAGVYMFSTLTIPDGAVIEGEGYSQTTLKQISGTNATAITATASNFTITNLGIDCNYFTSAWNAATGVLGNTSGNGLEVQGFGYTIDILLNNVAGVGAWFKDPGPENSASRIALYDISIVGRDFGKEGIIIQGPNDGVLRKAWIGRAGILPRPAAESAAATSSVYSGAQVDGIVIDGANIEIGDVHTYACWSGTGFRTRNTVRLTEGGRVIAESSRAQVNISANTYGSAFFDVRSLSLLHPNWAGAIPAYTLPDASFDGVTIAASAGFSCRITCKRTITQTARVIGTTAVVVTNDAKVDLYFSNSVAPTGDVEAGSRYSGAGLYSSSTVGGTLNVTGSNCNGSLVYLNCAASTVNFNARSCTVGLQRVSPTNSLRGNNIVGSIYRCTTGFVSTGQPAAENISLSMELLTGQTPFSGDSPSLSKAQIWNITASVNNVGYATSLRRSAVLDLTTAGDKTVDVAHTFLYTPDYQQVQITIDDRSTPTTSTVRCWINNITSTTITIGYRVTDADTDTNRANLRVNLLIQ